MYFRVQEHTVPTCHIREYPAATAHSQEEVLHLHVKQYTPLDATEFAPDAITLVGAHAVGCSKASHLTRLLGHKLIAAGALRATMG